MTPSKPEQLFLKGMREDYDIPELNMPLWNKDHLLHLIVQGHLFYTKTSEEELLCVRDKQDRNRVVFLATRSGHLYCEMSARVALEDPLIGCSPLQTDSPRNHKFVDLLFAVAKMAYRKKKVEELNNKFVQDYLRLNL